jgi:hypothetical protein
LPLGSPQLATALRLVACPPAPELNRAGTGPSATFVRADATTPVTGQAFDLAYARLLLSHLVEPLAALWAVRAALRQVSGRRR